MLYEISADAILEIENLYYYFVGQQAARAELLVQLLRVKLEQKEG